MIILGLILAGIALLVMRKQNKAVVNLLCLIVITLSLSGIAWAVVCDPIYLDGYVGDWTCQNIQPAVSDTTGDSSRGDYGEDIVAGFITSDDTYINFRVDIVGGEMPEF